MNLIFVDIVVVLLAVSCFLSRATSEICGNMNKSSCIWPFQPCLSNINFLRKFLHFLLFFFYYASKTRIASRDQIY